VLKGGVMADEVKAYILDLEGVTREFRTYNIPRGPATLAGLIGGCIFILLFAQSTWYFSSMALLAGLGFFQYIFRVGNNTLLQTIVPDALRGRVMSIYMLDNGLTPLATMAISFLIHVWSPAGAYTALALVSLALALLQLAFFRRIRVLV
jgi:hypothetical protein